MSDDLVKPVKDRPTVTAAASYWRYGRVGIALVVVHLTTSCCVDYYITEV